MDLADALGMKEEPTKKKKPYTLPQSQRQDVEGDAACFDYSSMDIEDSGEEKKVVLGEACDF